MKSTTLSSGLTVTTGDTFVSIRRMGSVAKGVKVKVKDIHGDRICIDVGAYALTKEEFISLFGKDTKPEAVVPRQWLKEHMGRSFDPLPDDAATCEFYYRAMHDHGMDVPDADRYAWLCTLFGYDIGCDHARAIINWFYENGWDVFDLSADSKDTVANVCCLELGIKLSFCRWRKTTPDCICCEFSKGGAA